MDGVSYGVKNTNPQQLNNIMTATGLIILLSLYIILGAICEGGILNFIIGSFKVIGFVLVIGVAILLLL